MSETLTLKSKTLTATDNSYPCQITNNAGVEVVVVNAYTTDASTTNSKQVYEQTLKFIKNGTEDTIKAGATGTITLSDTHVDKNGATQPNSLYNLILARPGTLFPVRIASAASLSTPRNFPPITIAASDAKNMSLAEQFWQTIMAYPTSDTAKKFNDTVSSSGNTATTSAQIDTNVQNFFKNNTTEYTTLTLIHVVAVQTYYNTYPFVWADYKGSKAYYLYTSDGKTTTYVGSVALNLPATPSADKTLPDGAIMFTDASNAKKNLYYKDGQFVDDITKDIPAVCLKGLFTLKSSLTKVDTDNVIIAILSGTVNQKTVCGYPDKLAPQPTDPSGKWWGLYPLLHPKNGMDWLNLLGQAMMLYMVYEMVTKKTNKTEEGLANKKAEKNGTEPSPPEVQQIRSDSNTAQKEIRPHRNTQQNEMHDSYQKLLDKFDANLKMTDDINATINDLQKKIKDRFNEEQRSTLNESLNKQGDMLSDMAQYEVTPAMEDMGDTISEDLSALGKATTEELPGLLPDIKTDVVNLNTSLKTEMQNIGDSVSAETAENISRTQEELKTAEKEADNIDKSAEEAREGKTPEDIKYESKAEFEL